MTSFTDAELKRMAKSLRSNVAMVKKWERKLGLQCMTTAAAVRVIREVRGH